MYHVQRGAPFGMTIRQSVALPIRPKRFAALAIATSLLSGCTTVGSQRPHQLVSRRRKHMIVNTGSALLKTMIFLLTHLAQPKVLAQNRNKCEA